MLWVYWRHNCPDELVADMYSYYGINILSSDAPLGFLATLAAQLPTDSRVYRFDDPDAGWSTEALILRELEFDFRAFTWGMAPKNKRGREPKPIPLPSEIENRKRELEEKRKNIKRAKEILGIKPKQ